MGRTYAALEPSSADYTMPDTWPTNPDGSPLWDFPYDDPDYDGPWPPGWPFNNSALGGQIVITGPGETYVDGANLSVELRIAVGDDLLNTNGYDGQILFVNAAVLDGDGNSTAVTLKNSTDTEYANYLNYTVDNYSGAKHGANPTLNFNVGEYTGQTLYIYAIVLAMDDTVEGYNSDAEVVGDYLSLNVPATIYDATALTVTCDVLDGSDDNLDEYEGETIHLYAASGGDTIPIKAAYGDSYEDGLDIEITNYTGSKYGFSSTIYFDLTGHESDTIDVLAYINDFEYVLGVDSGDGAENGDYLSVAVSTATITRGTDFTLTITAKDALDNTITGDTGTVALSLSSTPDPSDVLDNNSVPLTSVTLSSGAWTSSTVAISGGGGSDTCTILATKSGYVDGESETLTVSTPTSTGNFASAWRLDGSDNSWALARAYADASTPDNGDNRGLLHWQFFGGNIYHVQRGGMYITGLSDQTVLTANWKKEITAGTPAVSYQIQYAYSAPASGTEMRTAGTTLTTIIVSPGESQDTGELDCSSILGDHESIWIWCVAAADVTDAIAAIGFTSDDQNMLRITSLTAS